MRWLTECGLITVMAAAIVPATMTQIPSSSSHPEIGLACSTFVHIQAHEDPIVQLFTVMEDSDRDKRARGHKRRSASRCRFSTCGPLDLEIGEGGIRTPATVTRRPHFECGSFSHSDTSPFS